MSVLIKGMKMPKGCYECALRHRTFNGEETIHYCYAICEEVFDDGEVNEDCPLIPVPPHGDLIDRDTMIHDIQKAVAPSWYIKERNADMVKFLSLEDTIIPAEPKEEET